MSTVVPAPAGTRHLTVVFPEGRGVGDWACRNAESPVPSPWPYGLDGLGGDGATVATLDVPSRGRADRLVGRLFGPTRSLSRRITVPGTALCWDEPTALTMRARVRAPAMWAGVIWVTDRIGRPEYAREVEAVRRCLLSLDGLWCLSAPQVELIRDWLGPSGPPVHVVPFGIDTTFYAPAPYPRDPLVASVGGDRDRDAKTLFAALEEVRRQRPDVRCLVQTGSTLTPPEGVRIVPDLRHDEVRKLLARASVVAVATRPNRHVSGMTVMLESMSIGRPVVVNDNPGVRDYVADGDTGHVVAVNDPVAMAERVLEVLADPAAAREMGLRGSARVASRFTTSHMCTHLRRLVSTT